MRQLFLRLAIEDSGQDLIEYALVAAIVALSTAAVLRGMTNKIGTALNTIGTSLTNAV
jgi:pilus assembly protein Flp/PilA